MGKETLTEKHVNSRITLKKFDDLFEGNYMTRYVGYATRDPYLAAEAYEKRIGHKPTVIVARPEYQLSKGHPLVRRSNHGMGTGLLVTHLVEPNDITNGKHLRDRTWSTIEDAEQAKMPDVGESIIPKRGRGRPLTRNSGAICPHCGEHINDFERLGHWYGWALGIEPMYWEKLREHVFQRDNFTCQKCSRRLPANELRCHHIVRKEEGGTDSAKNLTTRCYKCHEDEHPIFPDDPQ